MDENNLRMMVYIEGAVTAVAFVILGTILLIAPSFADQLCVSLGVILVGMATAKLALCAYSMAPKRRRMVIFLGILLCLFGFWLVSGPEIIRSILSVLYGALIMCHAALDIHLANRLRALGLTNKTYAVAGFCVLALALVIFFNPLDTSKTMARLAGLVFLLDGLVLLYLLLQLFRQEKKKHRE